MFVPRVRLFFISLLVCEFGVSEIWRGRDYLGSNISSFSLSKPFSYYQVFFLNWTADYLSFSDMRGANVVCGVWGVVCGVRGVDFGVRDVTYRMRG